MRSADGTSRRQSAAGERAAGRRHHRGAVLALVVCVLAALSGFPALPASAAPGVAIVVDTTSDTHVAVAGGTTCVDNAGNCSLRAAVEAAGNLNSAGGPVTITVPAGTYDLTLHLPLVVGTQANETVSILGAGATTTVVSAVQPATCAGTPASCVQVFQLDSDGAGNAVPGVNATLSGLTISGGKISGTSLDPLATAGAGIGSGGPAGTKTVTTLINDIVSNNTVLAGPTNAPGGGISNTGGDLVITGSTFSNNTSGSSNGGAVDFEALDGNADALTVTGSTFSANSSSDVVGGGGAIYVAAFGTLSTSTVITSRFSGNTANGNSTGSAGSGGGAILQDGGTLTAFSNDFVNNSTTGPAGVGGAVNLVSGTATMAGNRFALNTGGAGSGATLAANSAGNPGTAITAGDNWWASNTGPTGADSTTGVAVTSYLVLRVSASPSTVSAGSSTTVTADLTHDQVNSSYTAHFVLPATVTFDSTAGGYGGGASATMVNGVATDLLTAGATAGVFPAGAHVNMDGVNTQASVTVLSPPSITSADSASFRVGAAGTFSVTTGGSPAPALSDGAAVLPTGVTFVDHGNGTATLAGTPAAGTGGTFPFTITAHSTTAPDATQAFTLTVNEAPTITSANATSFTAGTAGTFTVTTGHDFPAATTLSDGAAALPAGVTFHDNGDGTATLAGTPAAGSGGYPMTVTAHAATGPDATQAFTLTVNEAPSITSADSVTFTAGTAGTFTVTTGPDFPAATTLSDGAATLPTGVSFVDHGDGTATLAGTPAAGTGGTYPVTITAHNGSGPDATQAFTLTVNAAPSITSANSATFTVGAAGTFTVTTGHDFPAATTLSDGAAHLPAGVTFVDHGDGTATLGGTPLGGSGGIYPITITAHNTTAPDATQAFTLTVNAAPSITSADNTVFTVGTAGTFTLTVGAGFPRPNLSATPDALPDGVTFVAHGDGTATLAGTPAAGSGGTYSFTVTAHNTTAPDATQVFTLTVNEAPTMTSADAVTFTVGTAGSFTLTATGWPAPALSDGAATLPTGVTFHDNGDATATLAGTPATGSGGTYSLPITAHTTTAPDATQAFTLTVNEAPTITSAGTTVFTVGTAGTFTVTTGHDFPAATALSDGAATLPTGVTFHDNGDGTATLAGTPATGSGGTYSLLITAVNPTRPDATQAFTLTVNEAPAITSASATTASVGVASSFTVTSTGFDRPALSEAGALPAGMVFSDAHNGTATLSGTPAAGSSATYPLTITAHNATAPDAVQMFVLTVPAVPLPLGWSGWQEQPGPPPGAAGAPAVASWGPGRLDLFVRGGDNALWHSFEAPGLGFSAWESLGGSLTSAPTAVSWGPGHLDVLARGTDNALWHKSWGGAAWSGWEALGGQLASSPAVTSWSAGRLDVVARGTDNALWHKWYTQSAWSGWESMGGNCVGDPGAASWGPNVLDLFCQGVPSSSPLVWHRYWRGAWSGWTQDVPGTWSISVSADSRGANRLDLFSVAPSVPHSLAHSWWDGVVWRSEVLDGTLTSGPAAASWGPNHIDVFALGIGGKLYHKVWNV